MTGVTTTWATAVSMTFEVSVRLAVPAQRSQDPVDLDGLCRHVLGVAQARARRQGLRGEDAEDCALEFLGRMLQRRDWSELRPPGAPVGTPPSGEAMSEAWLRRCADNFARNTRRGRGRTARREVPWPEWEDADGATARWEGPAHGETPEALLLRADLDQRLLAAVGRLTPSQRDLFERHFTRGESVAEMGQALGRSPHAVSQALLTLRRRLKGLLERQGLDEETARQYLETTV